MPDSSEPTNDSNVQLPDVPVIPPEERVRHRGARPKLFISYAHANVAQVNEIARRLSNEFYYDVWIDYDSIRAGTDWKESLSLGIQEADAVLYMMTPESLTSEWCRAEIKHALKNNKPLIPIRLNNAIDNNHLKDLGIDHLQYLDFVATDTEPVWKKLIKDELKDFPVPPREIKLLENPALARLHDEYLRRLFNEFETVRLGYLLDAAPAKPVRLSEVYVPLRLGVSFNIEVENEAYIDWWLREVDAPLEKPADEQTKTIEKPKALNGFKPEIDIIPAWERILKEAWDDLKAQHESEQAEKSEGERKKLNDGTYHWNRIESETAPAMMQYLVITGNPGSGKSTLLKYMALAMAGQQLEDEPVTLDNLTFWPHLAYTPLYIELRSLVPTAFPNPTDKVTMDKIFGYIKDHILKPFDAVEYMDFLRDQMVDGDVIFMLDGLDEVPDAEDRREQVQDIISELKKSYSKCRIIVTSRPYAYYAEDWQRNDFGHVDLVDLEKHRLDQLASQLFHVVIADVEQANAQIEAFNQRMDAIPDELKRSPLFFTLLASIWLNNSDKPEDERLPTTTGAIYRSCVEMLIARWTRKDADGKSMADIIGLTERELRKVLETLAYRVHGKSNPAGNDEDSDQALFRGGDVMDVLEDLDYERKVDARELRDALAQRAGVIYARSPKHYQFAHRSFQEHLSACYLASEGQFPHQIITDVQSSPQLWRNVLDLLPDETDQASLWNFVKNVLPNRKKPLPTTRDDPRWWLLYYAIRWTNAHDLIALEVDDDIQEIIQKRIQETTQKIIELGALPPVERAEMGRTLAELGDTRHGVGLRDDGLPDIAWGEPVPAGTYTVGGDERAYEGLEEQQVTLEYSYKLAKFPVSYAQFEAFVQSAGLKQDEWWKGMPEVGNDGFGNEYPIREFRDQRFKHANHPRDNVTWYQAVAFCRWLTAQYQDKGLLADGEVIRLPTQHEWEIAARYPDGQHYAWGYKFDLTYANTDEGNNVGQTSPVGMYSDGKNDALDLYDLNGNVWEWTLSAWETGENHHEPEISRVLRGGSWSYDQHFARSVSRLLNAPDDSFFSYGFRLVCAFPIVK